MLTTENARALREIIANAILAVDDGSFSFAASLFTDAENFMRRIPADQGNFNQAILGVNDQKDKMWRAAPTDKEGAKILGHSAADIALGFLEKNLTPINPTVGNGGATDTSATDSPTPSFDVDPNTPWDEGVPTPGLPPGGLPGLVLPPWLIPLIPLAAVLLGIGNQETAALLHELVKDGKIGDNPMDLLTIAALLGFGPSDPSTPPPPFVPPTPATVTPDVLRSIFAIIAGQMGMTIDQVEAVYNGMLAAGKITVNTSITQITELLKAALRGGDGGGTVPDTTLPVPFDQGSGLVMRPSVTSPRAATVYRSPRGYVTVTVPLTDPYAAEAQRVGVSTPTGIKISVLKEVARKLRLVPARRSCAVSATEKKMATGGEAARKKIQKLARDAGFRVTNK